jgi:hypothetical protein
VKIRADVAGRALRARRSQCAGPRQAPTPRTTGETRSLQRPPLWAKGRPGTLRHRTGPASWRSIALDERRSGVHTTVERYPWVRVESPNGLSVGLSGDNSNSPDSRRLNQESSPTMRWSRKRKPTSGAASWTRRVAARSWGLGEGSPAGWLWARAKATPSQRSTAWSTSRTGSRERSAEPLDRGITRSARPPRSSTTTSTLSRERPASSGLTSAARSAGARTTGRAEGWTCDKRRASSRAATRPEALATPTPGSLTRSSGVALASAWRPPLSARIASARATALSPRVPAPSRMARSSRSASASGPRRHRRSRGRSCSGRSAIRSFTIPLPRRVRSRVQRTGCDFIPAKPAGHGQGGPLSLGRVGRRSAQPSRTSAGGAE